MPALLPTDYTAKVTWLGKNADRDATLRNLPVDEMELTFAGLAGESRAGLTRASCSRVSQQYPKGTNIRNTRQLSVVSEEELAQIATGMGIDRLDPAWISASLVLSGLPDFSHLPPSSRLMPPLGRRWWWIWKTAPAICPPA